MFPTLRPVVVKSFQRSIKPRILTVRHFLSPAYTCDEAWRRRLKLPQLEKIVPEEFYFEIEKKISSEKSANPLDIDLFCSRASETGMLDEMADLVHRLRRTPQTTFTFPSTLHTLIRSFLKEGEIDDLMRIIDDRVNYGVFLDDYTANLIMDAMINKNRYRDAAKVAVQLMLQEDFGEGVTPWMCLYSCDAHLRHPSEGPWDPNAPEVTEEVPEEELDEDEIEYVRVRYIPVKKYFDDHFDLRDGQALVGKTLVFLGKYVGGDVGRSYELIGWGLFKKWSEAEKLLTSDVGVASEALDRVAAMLDKGEVQEEVKVGLKSLMEKTKKLDINLESEVKSKLEEAVSRHEKILINTQENVYTEWENQRTDAIKKEMESIKRQERLKRLEEVKEELRKKEELFSFFDKRENLEFEIHKMLEKDNDARSRVKKTEAEEAYSPPELR